MIFYNGFQPNISYELCIYYNDLEQVFKGWRKAIQCESRGCKQQTWKHKCWCLEHFFITCICFVEWFLRKLIIWYAKQVERNPIEVCKYISDILYSPFTHLTHGRVQQIRADIIINTLRKMMSCYIGPKEENVISRVVRRQPSHCLVCYCNQPLATERTFLGI